MNRKLKSETLVKNKYTKMFLKYIYFMLSIAYYKYFDLFIYLIKIKFIQSLSTNFWLNINKYALYTKSTPNKV